MAADTVDVQADPDPMPLAGQRPGPPFFAVLVVAGLIVICAGMRSAASIVAPVFLVITLVITVAPLRSWLVSRRWPSWLASAVTLLAIYGLLILILGSVVFAVVRLVETLPDYASAFDQIFRSVLDLADRLGFGAQQIQRLATSVQPSTLAGPAQSLLSGVSGGLSLLVLIVTVVIFLTFESGTMKDRLTVVRETRPHIADGLVNFGQRVRKVLDRHHRLRLHRRCPRRHRAADHRCAAVPDVGRPGVRHLGSKRSIVPGGLAVIAAVLATNQQRPTAAGSP